MGGNVATKLQKALRAFQREMQKLDPDSRAAIEKQLKIVQAELPKLLTNAVVSNPTWWYADRPTRKARSKKR